MNPELKLVAHRSPEYPDAYLVRRKDDGKLLALGRDPGKAEAWRYTRRKNR